MDVVSKVWAFQARVKKKKKSFMGNEPSLNPVFVHGTKTPVIPGYSQERPHAPAGLPTKALLPDRQEKAHSTKQTTSPHAEA